MLLMLYCDSYEEDTIWFHSKVDMKTSIMNNLQQSMLNQFSSTNLTSLHYCYGTYENQTHFISASQIESYSNQFF